MTVLELIRCRRLVEDAGELLLSSAMIRGVWLVHVGIFRDSEWLAPLLTSHPLFTGDEIVG